MAEDTFENADSFRTNPSQTGSSSFSSLVVVPEEMNSTVREKRRSITIEDLSNEGPFKTNPSNQTISFSKSTHVEERLSIPSVRFTEERPLVKRRSSVLDSILSVTEEEKKKKSFFSLRKVSKFYLVCVVLPTLVSVFYSAAILFPPVARENARLFLWTDGKLTTNDEGTYILCDKDNPEKDAKCSEGIVQICLIAVSRVTAFASYALLAVTFISKMHNSLHWLSLTHASTFIPLEHLHKVHKTIGKAFFGLIILHTIGHFVRWFIRQETKRRTFTQVGISGLFGLSAMLIVIFSMSSWAKAMGRAKASGKTKATLKRKASKKRMRMHGPVEVNRTSDTKEKFSWENNEGKEAKRYSWMTFELRLHSHWLSFILLTAALCFHTPRCRKMTLTFVGLWALDNLYGYFFKTYRLDIVALTPLPGDAGVQMLWRNPKGFTAKSGEYVKIKLPWLSEGGDEWHAFSIYLREATQEGLEEVMRQQEKKKRGRVYVGCNARGGREIDPSRTALLLIEFQNEFATPGGKVHEEVKAVMDANDMVKKTVELAKVTRDSGGYVFHLPIIFDESGDDNPNQNLGILKDCHDMKLFIKDTWNAQIIDEHKPSQFDVIVSQKRGLDSFPGTDLEDLLEERNIETVILGGFLTNCCVESTMRSAYEKGYNVITLTDGTACKSHKEQEASINGTYKMFSTPMACADVAMALEGELSANLMDRCRRVSNPISLASEEPDYEQFVSFAVTELTQQRNPIQGFGNSLIVEEARKDLSTLYQTTQVFIAPSGDWTRRVREEIRDQDQLRSCWVRGPYTSPYHVASSFNHLVLVATGIGITPALGVMGQYPGLSRSKFLIWTTRSREMLKFFAPLFADAHLSAIYYTGKEPLTPDDMKQVRSYGKIFLQIGRPKELTDVIQSLIITFENAIDTLTRSFENQPISQLSMDTMDEQNKKAWCVFYCGGSLRIRDNMRDYTKRVGIEFEFELFDW